MAYNKAKFVANAQKLLHQGKIAQAIQEYVQILKQEPKDQATLMTVGDLYVRQGDTFQALEYFERLAQIYLADGFVTKAIAIYKKIAKLAPEETRPVEKLAELYVQQGVLSEARPIYLQLAELHQRAGRQEQASALLRKLLEAEPDNLRVLSRVAELAISMNQPKEAAAAFRNAAERLYEQGNHAEAIKFADRVIKIDAKDGHVVVIKARSLTAMGQHSSATSLLASLPNLEEGEEAAELLVHLYLQQEQLTEASELASRIFEHNAKKFAPLRQVSAKLLAGGKPDASLPLIDSIRTPMTEKGEHEALGELLTSAVERLPHVVEPHEWLVELYKQTSDSFRLPDALVGLAKVREAAGKTDGALQVYEEILDRDPENEAARRERDRLKGNRTASAKKEATALPAAAKDEPAALAETKEAPATAPARKEAPAAPAETISAVERLPQAEGTQTAAPGDTTDGPIDEETQRFIAQALTDVELFSSYGLTQKAIDLLEVILQRVPGHAQTLELLLDHHLGAGDERRTAELAEQLEQIHTTRGNTAAADRFADLRRRYAQAAQATEKANPAPVEPIPVPEFSLPAAAPETEPAEFTIETGEIVEAAAELAGEAASADSAVHELDLSEEWAALATELEANASEATASETKEAPPEADATQEFAVPAAETPTVDEVAEIEDLLKAEAAGPASRNGTSSNGNEPAADYVLELETAQAANEVVAKAPPATSKDFFDALSSDLDAALPELAPERAARNNSHDADQAAKSPATKPAPADVPQGPLSEIFDQFRSEVGEPGAEDEDLETHYNLGIAYREMGLIEEAISEFQKVAKGSSEGQAFRYAMQCCTLLGLAFMEKGQPAIAATWYERALAMPGLDQESILALRYDLGVAQELAGDMAAARKSFSQVYGMNIDYRDVAERLSSLGNER
jgi:tetratricopeptide (TPR) repeat protein